MAYALGIDLGTTFTAAAVARGGRFDIVGMGNHTSAIPSAVLLRDDGTLLVGDAALRRGQQEPARLAKEFKRRLGDATPIILGHTPYSAERLMAAVVRHVIDTVSERQGEQPTSVTIAHPANWGPYKRELLEQAAALAGIRTAEFVTEPEAAAVHFASGERVDEGGIVAVYDLGGGTFDAAVLRKQGDRFVTMGQPQGIERLGGIDLDESVMSHVRATLGDAFTSLDGTDPVVRSGMQRLREDCIAAKEALSDDSEAVIPVMLPGLQTQVRLTRPEFESMIRPVLRETVSMLQRALDVSGVTPAQLSAVVLAGGSSRIPLVAEMVSEALGRSVSVDAHPKDTVALGAARLAASPEPAVTPEPQAAPPPAAVTPTPSPQPAPAAAPLVISEQTPVVPRTSPIQPTQPTQPARPAAATPAAARSAPRRTAPSGAKPAERHVPLRPKRGRKREAVAAVLIVAAAVGVGGFVLANRGGGEASPNDTSQVDDDETQDDETEDDETGNDEDQDGDGCAAESGRCVSITHISSDGQMVVARYDTIGYDPHLDSNHVHFFFDTVGVNQAGIPANGPWEMWGLESANGEKVYTFEASTIPPQATQLCAAVANVNHGLERDHVHECVPLP